ncbi:anti-sigma factor domain-containing protein [Aeromicrobium sp. CF4.19]|uniref:anti-sigma factor n=1 Tax=Aeromicrobium sp. CF4.19 TaxID=3373082 RepID=UPI003EE7B91B
MSNDLHDLLVPYALDALDPHERTRFETHLDQCETCRDELPGFQATSVRIADAAAATPPPGLRVDVLARAQATRQERPVLGVVAHRSALRRSLPKLAVAASVLVATAGLGGYLVEHERAQDISGESQRITAVMSADDAAVLETPIQSGGTLRIMHSADVGDAVVAAASLEPLAADEVYQVWAMYDGAPQSVGLMDQHSSVLLAPDMGDAQGFAVTVEPSGGSDVPTSDPIASTGT